MSVIEAVVDDVPKGEVTDFYRSITAKDDELIAFGWIAWPDKATRDARQKSIFADMGGSVTDNPMPFDGKRMIFGGFEVVSRSAEA